MKTELIEKFFSTESTGTCTDSNFEFGNLYRKNVQCAFCVNNSCHYKGLCDRRLGVDNNEGWKTN